MLMKFGTQLVRIKRHRLIYNFLYFLQVFIIFIFTILLQIKKKQSLSILKLKATPRSIFVVGARVKRTLTEDAKPWGSHVYIVFSEQWNENKKICMPIFSTYYIRLYLKINIGMVQWPFCDFQEESPGKVD